MAANKGIKVRKIFLEAVAATGNILKAAKLAGCDRSAHYWWLKYHPDYRELFTEAMEQAGDAWEAEAARRASEGVLKAKFYQGKAIGTERVYSDALMAFLLTAAKPGKYRQNVKHEISGPLGGPISIEQKRLQHLTDAELASLIAIAKKLAAPARDGGGSPEAGEQ